MSILSQVSSPGNHDGSAVGYALHIPTYELLRRELCASPVGTFIEGAVRRMARSVGRSAGAISPALKRLAADGWISYLSDGRGTLIEVLRSDQETDRSVFPQSPPIDASTAPASHAPLPTSDQVPDRLRHKNTSDQVPDRSACMVHDDLRIQEEEESARDPLFDRLTAEPSMSRSLATRIASHPPGTVADFESDLQVAETFANQPFWFAVARWRDGQRVTQPEEQHHERPARSDVPAYQRGRSARRASGSHNPTGGAELHNPGWAQRAIAAAEAEGLAQGYANG